MLKKPVCLFCQEFPWCCCVCCNSSSDAASHKGSTTIDSLQESLAHAPIPVVSPGITVDCSPVVVVGIILVEHDAEPPATIRDVLVGAGAAFALAEGVIAKLPADAVICFQVVHGEAANTQLAPVGYVALQKS